MKVFIIISLLVSSVFAWSQVGYVSLEKVLKQTKQGRSINKKLEKEFENRRSQIQKREKQLQEDSMKLESEIALLSESEKRKKAKQMQQRVIEHQKFAENSQREMADYQKRLISDLVVKMKPVIAVIAKKQNLTRVQQLATDVLWISDQLDITQQVIKAYNKKYK